MNIFKKIFGSNQANMKEETTMTNTQKALELIAFEWRPLRINLLGRIRTASSRGKADMPH